MGKKLYVGGLSYSIDEQQLRGIFEKAGAVESATVITDRATGNSKGFGFVEMAAEQDAQNAIQTLHGTVHDGRSIIVSEARPQASGSGGGGNRGSKSGGGFGGARDRSGRSGGGGNRNRSGW